MTVQELEEQLKALGIDVGSWKLKEPGQFTPAGDLFKQQEAVLLKIQGLLEKQLTQDQATLADLHIALNKAKFGSGR